MVYLHCKKQNMKKLLFIFSILFGSVSISLAQEELSFPSISDAGAFINQASNFTPIFESWTKLSSNSTEAINVNVYGGINYSLWIQGMISLWTGGKTISFSFGREALAATGGTFGARNEALVGVNRT